MWGHIGRQSQDGRKAVLASRDGTIGVGLRQQAEQIQWLLGKDRMGARRKGFGRGWEHAGQALRREWAVAEWRRNHPNFGRRVGRRQRGKAGKRAEARYGSSANGRRVAHANELSLGGRSVGPSPTLTRQFRTGGACSVPARPASLRPVPAADLLRPLAAKAAAWQASASSRPRAAMAPWWQQRWLGRPAHVHNNGCVWRTGMAQARRPSNWCCECTASVCRRGCRGPDERKSLTALFPGRLAGLSIINKPYIDV